VVDLFQDLRDGSLLLKLLELLTGKELVNVLLFFQLIAKKQFDHIRIILYFYFLFKKKQKKKEIGRMKVHHLGNVNIVLSTLKEHKVKISFF